MTLSRSEQQAISELAGSLVDCLPGPIPNQGDKSFSFQGLAEQFQLGAYWTPGGAAKRQSLTNLLENTFTSFRFKFSGLVVEIVSRSIQFRQNSERPVTREEVKQIHRGMARLGLRVPEFLDERLLSTLAQKEVPVSLTISSSFKRVDVAGSLKDDMVNLGKFSPEQRLYAFEGFVNKLFVAGNVKPKSQLRTEGDAITGVVELDGKSYYVCAKCMGPATAMDLVQMKEKAKMTEAWSGVIFISYGGLTGAALDVIDDVHNLLIFDGQDLFLILQEGLQLEKFIRLKAICAEKEGRAHAPVQELMSLSGN